MSPKSMISEDQKIAAEEQIRSLRKEIDYNTRDYSIDFLIQQFRDDEFYIGIMQIKIVLWNLSFWDCLFLSCSFLILRMDGVKS